mmetsp:Transcript_12409/g.20845  ORF Transcript_12409/g.20845 Transcript_12409/m.20845 type:complete len:335 (-) Transcript_12409:40-1044(-)
MAVLGELLHYRMVRFYRQQVKYRSHGNNNLDSIKFMELHAGPEYLFHMKTASLNAVIFIALAMGLAFPLLFLIALLAIAVQYIVERYTLARVYRLPPKFSLSITETNNQILQYAPLVASALGFWLMGNFFMFNNDPSKLPRLVEVNDVLKSKHTLESELAKFLSLTYSDREKISLVPLILIGAFLIVKALSSTFSSLGRAIYGSQLKFQKTELPNYFKALREQDLEEMVEEEQIFASEFGLENMKKEKLMMAAQFVEENRANLKLGGEGERQLIGGEPYYQCYKNFDYWMKFNIQNAQEERKIKLLLSLPLIPPQLHSRVVLQNLKLRKRRAHD